MNVYVLDGNFQAVGIVDNYTSLIWATRYQKYGDFEIYLSASPEKIELLRLGRFLVREEDIDNDGKMRNVMRIEKIKMSSDAEDGDYLTVSGRDLKGILTQRVASFQTVLSGPIPNVITSLLNRHVIAPVNEKRKIDFFERGSDMLRSYKRTSLQITGKNIEETIESILSGCGFGWDIYVLTGKAYIYLYEGHDRSYGQSENPFAVISPEFDNLISSEYEENKEGYINAAFVAGEGEGKDRKIVEAGESSGVDRYEAWIDARNQSSNNGEISESEYRAQLLVQGEDYIASNDISKKLSGEIEPEVNYRLGVDYDLGDIIQIETSYGVKARSRIVEIIDSEDESGRTVIPTFDEMIL